MDRGPREGRRRRPSPGARGRIGGSEGIAPRLLPRVDMDALAASFADGYPRRRYPAALVGASNGALTHLAAAMQVPWLPTTVLVPVSHVDDPEQAGRALAFGRRRGPALLVGLSVGTQVAAVCAARSSLVRRLLLVSPTIAPQDRTRWRTIRGFLAGEDHPDAPSKRFQVPDWARAGVPRIYRGLVSALGLPLEDVLGGVTAQLTLAHADADSTMSPLSFAADLAHRHGGRLLVLPDAPHSWPVGDGARFVSVVERLLAEPPGLTDVRTG